MAALTYLTSARRIVVKVGSALLVNTDGTLRAAWLDSLAHDLAGLKRRGYDIVIVSSGAIAFGRNMIMGGNQQRNNARLSLAEKQAAAAIGQIRLNTEWQQAMAKHDMTTAQILL